MSSSILSIPVQHKQTLREDFIIRSIKILDFAFIIPIYTLGAVFGAIFLDKYVYKYMLITNKYNIQDETDVQLFTNIVILLLINTITAYILRNLLQKIPFPFENVYGFKHMKVSEVKSGSIITMILLIFSNEIRVYIQELQRRYTKKKA
jgi:hypothetical protein